MPDGRDALIARRERLLARSAQLRSDLRQQSAAFERPLAWTEQAQAGWRWVRANRHWVLGGIGLVFALRPGRTLAWGGRLLGAWQFWQRTRPLWMRLFETIERRI